MAPHPIALLFTGWILASCSLVVDPDEFTRTPPGSGAPTNAGGEDCTNGVDDDQDGLVDCADPKCGAIGYACQTVPVGWQGPYVVASGATALACASPYGVLGLDGHDGLVVPPASCACSCGPETGATCSVALHYRSSCGSPLGTSGPKIPTTCTNVGIGSNGILAQDAEGDPGRCSASAAPQAAVTWNRTIRGCGPDKDLPVGGCASVARCAPPAPSGFARGTCITRDGDQTCPAEFPSKTVAYLGVSDDRKCVGCECTAPACTSELTVFDGPNCTGNSVTVSTVCEPATAESVRAGSPARICTVSRPGTASGTATASQPTTVCCAG